MLKAVISHPGRQHSHQTCLALQEGGLLSRFFTVFWFGKSMFKRIEKIVPRKLLNELMKRNFNPIDDGNVRMNYNLFSREAILRILGKNQVRTIYRLFDKWVSRELERTDNDIFIGYEMAALKSFERSKALGRICVLDLAQVHHSFQRKIFDIYGFKLLGSNPGILDLQEKMKQEELSLVDYIFTPTEFSRKTLLDAGISAEKIFKIPYGCDTEHFRMKKTSRKNDKFKILFVGLFGKRKGIQYLLQALDELKLENAELVCIGKMVDGEDVFRQYQGNFRYIPFLHHKEIVRYYQDADLFVLPSLLDSFGMVVLEAMACGTPVIVTEHTGAKEVVREGTDGFTVPVMDVCKLKEKILMLYENRDMAAEMGQNARKQAEQYTWERYRQGVRDAVSSISRGSSLAL